MGTRFGKYTLLEKIGSGGMAEIWKANLSGVDGFEKVLVLKKILPKFAKNRQFITMFVQEAKVTSILHHANIVQIYELGEQDGEYFIAMEYVNGPDLLKILTSAAKAKKPIPPALCLHILTEVCKGLGYAHSATDIYGNPLNMVHLDVSPSNILVTWEGEVKLTDFGVAKVSASDTPTADDDRLKGKLGYMSPEQVTAKQVDSRSDLFSIGIILYEIFTLKRLFLGRTEIETLTNVRDADVDARLARYPTIPEGVKEIIRRSLMRNVDSRFQTAYEIEEAISHYLFEERLRVTPHAFSRYLEDLFGRDRASTQDSALLADRTVVGPHCVSIQPNTVVDEGRKSKKAIARNNSNLRGLEGSQFTFKTGQGGTFGPVDAKSLIRLIRAQAVLPTELTSVDGGPWQPLSEITGVRALMPEEASAPSEAPLEIGDFGPRSSFRAIADIIARKRSVRIRIRSTAVLKEIFFRRGKPVRVVSNQKPELLGPMLVTKHLLTANQLQTALDQSNTDGLPLGATLVKMGYIDAVRLSGALEGQLFERFVSIFAIVDGRYEYFGGSDALGEGIAPAFEPIAAVVEGARRYLQPAFLDQFLTANTDRSVRLAADLPFDPIQMKLTPREHRIFTAISGRPTSVPALMRDHGRTPESRQLVLFVLFVANQTGIVRLA